MNILLRVDKYTGEPYLDCKYNIGGEIDDQVMARLHELLKNHKLEINGSGSDPRGGIWFRLRVDKQSKSDEDE